MIWNSRMALPTRLYDCVDMTIRESNDIRLNLALKNPPYLIVSHIWGETKNVVLPGIPWECPITDGKFDLIVSYCTRNNIRWFWLDCICIKQYNSADEVHAKEAEVGAMNQYYRNASQCLCVPHDPESFMVAHAQQLKLTAFVGQHSLSDEALQEVWEKLEYMDTVVQNPWFSRSWTYQELLLSDDIRLPNGARLDVDQIAKVVKWVWSMIKGDRLRQPPGAKDYAFLSDLTEEVQINNDWRIPVSSWELRHNLAKTGSLDLMSVVTATREKNCKYPVDRLYSLYGLLQDDDKVPVDYFRMASEEARLGPTFLSIKWKETMVKVIQSGRVWPLLKDAMDSDAARGEIWMPRITCPSAGYGEDHIEIIDSRNTLPISVTDAGLEMSVRDVGRIVATSASFGDGGGEWNRIAVCIWILAAEGFDIRPVRRQMEAALDQDGWPEESKQALAECFHANSLYECFGIIETKELRRKLRSAIGQWNRSIVAIEVVGSEKPIVLQAWIHRTVLPNRGKCFVMDVTSGPVKDAKRWVIANREDDGTYTKIGTVQTHPTDIAEDKFRRVMFN